MSKQSTEKASTLSPRTPEGAELITCFRVLSKRTESRELQQMMPALMKLTAAMRSENKQDEIAGRSAP